MPRDYKRKLGSRCYQNYTELKLEEALEAVADNKMSLRQASREFNIPYGTLHNKFNGKHGGKPGRRIVFSEIEELAIINGLLTCSDWSFPLSAQDVQMFTKMHLDLEGRIEPRFQNNVPGKDWVLSLLKRHKDKVGQRMASNLKTSKAEVSREILNEYFKNLDETLKDVPPCNIFNYDETNVSDDPGKMKGIYRRGVKYPVKICNHSKSATTVLMCGSASGILLPPYIIYRSEGIYDTWKEGGLKGEPCCSDSCCSRGFRYNRTKHGWIDSATFHDWFISTFLPHAKRLEGKVILIGDNLSSHFNENVLQLCKVNNIDFVCLPPNATHLCQPLDVSFFRAFKVAWRHELTVWKQNHPRVGVLPKHVFPSLLSSAIQKMDSVVPRNPTYIKNGVSRNLVSGFKATGIAPFNPNYVLEKFPLDANPDDVQKGINESLVAFLQKQREGGPVRIPRKKKLTVTPGKSVVASSSEDSDDNEKVVSSSESESDEHCEEEEVFLEPVLSDDICPGQYALVKFYGGSRKKTVFRYACIIQEVNNMDIKVMGMKSVDNGKKLFKAMENDISSITKEDILGFLPIPKIQIAGQRVLYDFAAVVDVKES